MITLQYMDGATNPEQKLSDWGFSDEWSINTINLSASTCSFRKAVANASAALPFPYAARVIVRIGRSVSFTGGTILFQGWRMKHISREAPGASAFDITFADAWFWLNQICFQQLSKTYNGDPAALVTKYTSDLFLFRDIAGLPLNTGAQITEILTFANTAYNAKYGVNFLTIGTIEPAVNVPSYQVKDIMCSEALHNCLRSSPDVTCYIDHTTTPPTIHFKKRLSLTPVSLPWRASGHQTSQLVPREDLVLDYCRLVFKRENEVDGVTWFEPTIEIYPAIGFTGIEPGGLNQTIDLAGFSRSTLRGTLNIEAVPAAIVTGGGSQATRLAWWTKMHPEFASTRYRNHDGDAANLIFGNATITDEAGAAVSLSNFPNRLLPDSAAIAPWMRLVSGTAVTGKKVNVTMFAAYDEYDVEGTSGSRTATNGLLERSTFPNGKKFTVSLTLTNGISGEYSAVASEISAEDLPADLAQSIVGSLAALQFEGQHTFHQTPETARSITIANSLNISGGLAAWSAMKSQIQEINEDFNSGRRLTTVRIGVAPHLEAGDLTQLFLFNRFRVVWNNPAVREQARMPEANSSLPNAHARENTTDGLSEYALQKTIKRPDGSPAGTPTGEIHHDPKAIETILAATTPTAVDGSVSPKQMKPLETVFCDEAGDIAYGVVLRGGLYTKP